METDQTTLNDLSIFNQQEDFCVFDRLNMARTIGGREQLRQNLSVPLSSAAAITGIQHTLQNILQQEQYWPTQISNGTIMVIEKFYETAIDDIPASSSDLSAWQYKVFHGPDFSLVKYSAVHCFDFIKGMQLFVQHFLSAGTPAPLKALLEEVQKTIDKKQFEPVAKVGKAGDLTTGQLLYLAHFVRVHFKQSMLYLMQVFFQLDAWYSMAIATKKLGLTFPEFTAENTPVLEARELYHLLLEQPVAYNVLLDAQNNFLFLTGANMAGKSTFIKSVGIAVFLAHTGMGVPAKNMRLTCFDGLLSNINVADNLVKGESYFFNEVQRIKATVTKINDGKKWLILIDELFKGTNIQDAMKCSSTVIEGLIKIRQSLFILSTHLYEIGEDLRRYPNIQFRFFETAMTDGQLHFSYQLQEGISNDRLGYLILKKEGVVELLEKL